MWCCTIRANEKNRNLCTFAASVKREKRRTRSSRVTRSGSSTIEKPRNYSFLASPYYRVLAYANSTPQEHRSDILRKELVLSLLGRVARRIFTNFRLSSIPRSLNLWRFTPARVRIRFRDFGKKILTPVTPTSDLLLLAEYFNDIFLDERLRVAGEKHIRACRVNPFTRVVYRGIFC